MMAGFCDQNRPEMPLACNVEPLPNGYVSVCITQKMIEPTGSPHVRGVAIYLPQMQDIPNLSVRIISSAASALLMVTSLKINENVGGYMQVAVAAQGVSGGPATGVHHCNIIAIGKPLAAIS
jgi:hypothetical protein